eukprot:TRINITY_DN6373_c1_g1_i1.p2 TRINITY_DN6373_c1_g1~~TRINITY_DN6373_c1_g1_i1.p2  ORF type:complete len:226 (+),score=42.95 TRINITY_DN6373_c1_g1_i1:525-1202(+)
MLRKGTLLFQMWMLKGRLLYQMAIGIKIGSMAEVEEGSAVAGPSSEIQVPEAKVVEYDHITGIPSEFNEFLPKDSVEYKNWKAFKEGGGEITESMQDMKLNDKKGEDGDIEKKLPGGKTKKKAKQEIILEVNTRNKKKSVTTVSGLDTFGVKMSEAAKLFGKKFACGSSVVKSTSAPDKEQIDIQGDVLDGVVELIMKQYGEEKGIPRSAFMCIESKKKVPYFGD